MATTAQITINVDSSAAATAFDSLSNSTKALTSSAQALQPVLSAAFNGIPTAVSYVIPALGQMNDGLGQVQSGFGKTTIATQEARVEMAALTGSVGAAEYSLARLAATSGALAPVIAAAFPVLGAVALVGIVAQLADALPAVGRYFEDLVGYSESLGPAMGNVDGAMKEWLASTTETSSKLAELQQQYELIGLSGPQKLVVQQQQLNAQYATAETQLQNLINLEQSFQTEAAAAARSMAMPTAPTGTGEAFAMSVADAPSQAAAAVKAAQSQGEAIQLVIDTVQNSIAVLTQQLANAGKATADAFKQDNLQGLQELGDMANEASQHLDDITKSAQSSGLTGLDKIQEDWEKNTQAISDYLVASGNVDKAAQAQTAVDQQRANALSTYYTTESDDIQKATTEWYASVLKANNEAAEAAQQSSAQQIAAAEQTLTYQQEAAQAMLPPWEQAYGNIELEAQRETQRIEDQLAQQKIDNQDAAADIAAVQEQEFGKMRDQVAGDIESAFNDLTSGNLAQAVKKAVEDMVAQLLATWILGMNGVKSATQSVFGSGSLFGGGGLFGGASSIGPGGTATFASAGLGDLSGLLGGSSGALSPATASALGLPVSGGSGVGVGNLGTPGMNAAAKSPLNGLLSGLGGSFMMDALLTGGGLSLLGASNGNAALSGLGGFLTGGGLGAGISSAAFSAGIISPFLAFLGPIGAIAGGILGALFGSNSSKIAHEEEALEDQLQQQLQTLLQSFEVQGTDYSSAISDAESLRTQFTQAQNQIKQMSAQQQHDYVDQYVDATEGQINQIEAQRNANQTTMNNLPLAEFATGGFTPSFLPGGHMRAILHPSEAILNPTGRMALGDDAIKAANRGQTVTSHSNAVHIGELHVHAAPGMDEQQLADRVIKRLNNSLGDRGRKLGSR